MFVTMTISNYDHPCMFRLTKPKLLFALDMAFEMWVCHFSEMYNASQVHRHWGTSIGESLYLLLAKG